MGVIILIMLGLLFSGADIFAAGMHYPDYIWTKDIGDKIQEYITRYVLNDRVKIDVLPDMAGCVLLFIGVLLLLKYSGKFTRSIPLLFLSAVLSVVLPVIPFFMNGKEMIVTVLVIYFLQIVCEIYAEFIILYTLVDISNMAENKATNTRVQFGWWLSVFCRIFIVLLTFVGHITAANVYKGILIAVTIFMLYHMRRILKYISSSERSAAVHEEQDA